MATTSTSVSIVLVGTFEPDRFSPEKLSEGKVISPKTAQEAKFKALLTGQVLDFRLAWADMLVMPDKFQVSTSEAPYIRICDLVMASIHDLAPNSKVTQFGINVEFHYDFGSFDARNEFGCSIAPPTVWQDWGQLILESMRGPDKGTSRQGGVLNVTMRLPFQKGAVSGWRDVTVAPSNVIRGNTGVLFRANHHHQLSELSEGTGSIVESLSSEAGTRLLLQELTSTFEKSVGDSIGIFHRMVGGK